MTSGLILPKPVWNFRLNFHNVFMRTFMYGMVGSLAMFITSWEKADRMKDRYLDKNRDFGDTYDFIIVGGGSSGSVVANRLSNHYKVLLLEAGGDPHPYHSIPLMANFMSNYPELDWSHKTVPQKHGCFGSVDNQAIISQGLSLGGTSNLDYMMYLRGHPEDYNNWSGLIGDKSWAWDNVMSYFKKHENYEGPWKDNNKFHGTTGEMSLALPPYTGMGSRFCRAGREMGYSHVDLNGQYSEGFDMFLYPTKRGYRQAAYKSFLQKEQKDRWNLVIYKYAHVNRILTRGDTTEAYAVEFDRHGKRRLAYAKKEIILSAGAIQSPKILMLSGLGPIDHLQSLGIPPKVNLPLVGSNLQDHLAVHVGPFFTKSKETFLLDRDLTAPAMFQYAMSTGPLTSTGYEAGALLTSDLGKINGNSHWPDVLLMFNGMALHETADEDFAYSHRMRPDLLKDYWAHSKGKDSFSIVVSAARPKSKGNVKLRDKDPYSTLLIDPKYLEQIEDVGVMVDGIKKAMRLVENTLSFKQIGAQFTNESVSGCEQYKFKSEDYWACFVRLMSVSMGDVAGTLGMGRVVDSELNVYGTSRLRVIDVSVMPEIVSTGTGAAALMIGEKGADLIMKLWGIPDKQKGYAVDGKIVKEFLKQSAAKLRGIDGGSLFWNNIKESQSFKEFKALEESQAKSNAAFWQPPLTFGRPLEEEQAATTIIPTLSFKVPANPFKLIGTMFKNSFNSNPTEQSFTNGLFESTTAPQGFGPSPSYFTPERTTADSSFFLNPPTKPTTKRPNVDTLFSGGFGKGNPTYPLEEVSSHGQYEQQKSTSSIESHGGVREVPPTPYILSPQPFTFQTEPSITTSKQNAIKYGNEIKTNFYIPIKPTLTIYKPEVSFSSAVDSIISKTLPILSGISKEKVERQKQENESFFGIFGSKNNRRETLQIKSQNQTLTKNNPISSTTTLTTLSPLEALIPKPIRVVTQPLRSFSKIVNAPFEGILNRIRTVLRPTMTTPLTNTTIASKPTFPSQEDVLGIKINKAQEPRIVSIFMPKLSKVSTPPSPSFRSVHGLDHYVKQMLLKDFETTTFTSSASSPTPVFETIESHPEGYFSYEETHKISQNNTFTHPITLPGIPIIIKGNKSTENNERPPIDYELIEVDSILPQAQPLVSSSKEIINLAKTKPNIKVIYERPPSISTNKDNPNVKPNLAQNVQELLKSFETSTKERKGNAQEFRTPSGQMYESYILNDPKNLNEEISKLISKQNITNESEVFVIFKTQKQSKIDNPIQDVNLKKSLTQRPVVAVKDSIKELLKDRNLYEKINDGLSSKDSISSNNLLLDSSKSETTPKVDYKELMWPTDSSKPAALDNLSFRIKILNQ